MPDDEFSLDRFPLFIDETGQYNDQDDDEYEEEYGAEDEGFFTNDFDQLNKIANLQICNKGL